MNLPREGSSAGQESVHAEIEGDMRLRFELHLGYQQIGRSCAIGVSTVHKF